MQETKLYSIALNPLQTNCYLLVKNNHCIIFDPSLDSGGDFSRLQKLIDPKWTVDAIILTHGHFDHISAVDALVDVYGCPVYIHFNDEQYLYDSRKNASNLQGIDFVLKTKPITIVEGQLVIGEFEFEVVLTPGHTPGSITLFYDDLAFVGDCIFKDSIGRTDLVGGSMLAMRSSLAYFKSLTKDYKLLPGHGPKTTLSRELRFNPFLNS